ncbi:MAG: hypothetical protein JST40_07000 [Armatimonadetes bacterium]|nr:hypothetical protein [Armatimonadota bacterium]
MAQFAFLGAGNLACAPQVLATLASCRFERELEITLYDSDAERLDLTDRLARAIFSFAQAEHVVRSFDDLEEALGHAKFVWIGWGSHCIDHYAARCLNLEPSPIRGMERITESSFDVWPSVATSVEVDHTQSCEMLELDLERLLDRETRSVMRWSKAEIPHNAPTMAWPEEPVVPTAERLPHQVLRWILADDPLDRLVATYEDSPLRRWLTESGL